MLPRPESTCPAPRSRAWAFVVAPPLLAALAVLPGCASGSPGTTVSASPPPSCFVPPEDIDAASGQSRRAISAEAPTVVLGLSETVDPGRAPVPAHPGEAFVFRTLYESLVQMDCEGRIRPALASSWQIEEGGRRWTFTLREGARFWDGTPVTPRRVAESWQRAEASGLSPWGPIRPVSLSSMGERRIQVVLDDDQGDAARVFSSPGLAVVGESSLGRLPTGTGPYRVAEGTDEPGESLLLRSVSPDAPSPTIRVETAPGGDLRDLLAGTADLVITGDPATLAYARLRPDLRSLALPWSDTYALVHPPTERAPVPPGFLESLARDVVREEARPAGGGGCPVVVGVRSEHEEGEAATGAGGGTTPVPAPATDIRRILYPEGDPVARSIGERIVALAAIPPARRSPDVDQALRSLGLAGVSSPLVATPIESIQGAGTGDGRAVRLIRIPREAGRSCPTGSSVERGFHAVPLVDTRLRMVTGSQEVPVAVDGWGTPFIPGSR